MILFMARAGDGGVMRCYAGVMLSLCMCLDVSVGCHEMRWMYQKASNRGIIAYRARAEGDVCVLVYVGDCGCGWWMRVR